MTTGGRGEQVGVDVGDAFQAQFHVGFGNPAGAVAEFLHHQFGGVGVERLGDGRHDAHLHQRLDDLRRPRGHAVGEFLHGDLFRQDDVAHDLDLVGAQPVEFGLPALALALPADRGQRADFLILSLDRGLHVDTPGAAAVIGAALGGARPAACGPERRRRRAGGPGVLRPRPPAERHAGAAFR